MTESRLIRLYWTQHFFILIRSSVTLDLYLLGRCVFSADTIDSLSPAACRGVLIAEPVTTWTNERLSCYGLPNPWRLEPTIGCPVMDCWTRDDLNQRLVDLLWIADPVTTWTNDRLSCYGLMNPWRLEPTIGCPVMDWWTRDDRNQRYLLPHSAWLTLLSNRTWAPYCVVDCVSYSNGRANRIAFSSHDRINDAYSRTTGPGGGRTGCRTHWSRRRHTSGCPGLIASKPPMSTRLGVGQYRSTLDKLNLPTATMF